MGSKNNDEVLIGANGSVYVADVGTAEPADISVALVAGFSELGFTSEDGVTVTDGISIFDVMAWQSFYAIRKGVESREFTVAFQLQQFSGENVVLALGGGTVVDDTGGNSTYEPPSPETINEKALAVEWVDGGRNFRLLIPRCIVMEDVEFSVVRTENVGLPLSFGVIGEDGVLPYRLQTDDASFAAIAV